jgi:NAD(P)-dependent dehydrogenase (short-subunit alcohol dehydrogenase family)
MTAAAGTRTLQGKNAIVTGGASGIGRAIAELFTARGARVHVVDIKAENGPHTHACDCADEGAVERVFGDVFSMLPKPGRIDILVNSVGVAHVGTLESTAPADFDHVMRVNVRSFYNTMRAVIGPMKAAGGGVILNLASIAATAALADRFAYSTSKGAVMAMTLSVAKDYLRHNIRCNCISPARIHTPFVDGFVAKNYPGREEEIYRLLAQSQPIGRMGRPEEVAALALFLCSDDAAFITGTDYPIDGGFFNLR